MATLEHSDSQTALQDRNTLLVTQMALVYH